MGALITTVFEDSIAQELGIEPGDRLVKINGRDVQDILDYRFYGADEEIKIEILRLNGDTEIIEIEKEAGEDLGLGFDEVIFTPMKKCANKCLFCFIDQLPGQMRESLYFKDDDYRLSFLYGNFISLTNLTSTERQRIYDMRLSPLYVSVHSMVPEVRAEIMGNPRAAGIEEEIKALQEHGLSMHAQIVLCPGINDGEGLTYTIERLASYYPAVLSVGIVPVGITNFSPRLDRIRPVSAGEAGALIRQVEDWQARFRKSLGTGFVYIGDEFYVRADRPFPQEEYYDDFCQIENGIGLCRALLNDFADLEPGLPRKVKKRDLVLITGLSSVRVLTEITDCLNRIQGLHIDVLPVENHFFGEQVTVTGLLTGRDIMEALGSSYAGRKVVVPEVALKDGEQIFLDDMTVEDLARTSGAEIIIAPVDARGLAACVLGRKGL